MKLGITGLGRAGKTTVFNALTRRSGESVSPGGQVVPALGRRAGAGPEVGLA